MFAFESFLRSRRCRFRFIGWVATCWGQALSCCCHSHFIRIPSGPGEPLIEKIYVGPRLRGWGHRYPLPELRVRIIACIVGRQSIHHDSSHLVASQWSIDDLRQVLETVSSVRHRHKPFIDHEHHSSYVHLLAGNLFSREISRHRRHGRTSSSLDCTKQL